jgi:hypothetical protein
LISEFFKESTGFHGQKYAEIAEVKLSRFGVQKKLLVRHCGVAVAEQHFFKKLRVPTSVYLKLRMIQGRNASSVF